MTQKALTALGVAGLIVAGRAQTRSAPDTIYVNGTVVTMDDQARTVEAMAVSGDRISAVGTTAAVRALAGSATRTIDLAGKTVLPGFVDAHSHFPRRRHGTRSTSSIFKARPSEPSEPSRIWLPR